MNEAYGCGSVAGRDVMAKGKEAKPSQLGFTMENRGADGGAWSCNCLGNRSLEVVELSGWGKARELKHIEELGDAVSRRCESSVHEWELESDNAGQASRSRL
jgi:hypothetical protein